MVDHIDFTLPVSSNLVMGRQEDTRDSTVFLNPLEEIVLVLDGRESLMSKGCDAMFVWGVVGTTVQYSIISILRS